MAEHDTPTFPIALRGLALLSGLSGLLGEATSYYSPEPDMRGADGGPMVLWQLESGLKVVLFITPNCEHVVIAKQPEHPLYCAVHELCGKFEIDIRVLNDNGSPVDSRMRQH